jgi:hypothetical protein
MAEDPPAVTDEALTAQARRWFDEHWTGSGDCPICQTDGWQIGTVSVLPAFKSGFPTVPSTVLPVVPVICNTCGFTHFFNAVLAGLVDEHGQRTPK